MHAFRRSDVHIADSDGRIARRPHPTSHLSIDVVWLTATERSPLLAYVSADNMHMAQLNFCRAHLSSRYAASQYPV